jgi:hypothetical protein
LGFGEQEPTTIEEYNNYLQKYWDKSKNSIMKRSAAQRIEDHEKLCRIMQKQTFEQIKEVKERIYRMEKMIISGALGIIIALLLNVIK